MLTFSEATRISACHNAPNRNPALSHPQDEKDKGKNGKLPFWDCQWYMLHSPHTPVIIFFLGQSITLNPHLTIPFVIIIF